MTDLISRLYLQPEPRAFLRENFDEGTGAIAFCVERTGQALDHLTLDLADLANSFTVTERYDCVFM